MSEENSETGESARRAKRRPLTRGEQMGLMAVIAMGVILVVGFVVVVFTIATRLSNLEEGEDAPQTAEVLRLAPESEVVSSALDGDRLALTVREAAGTAVYLIELPEGRMISRTAIGE